MTPRLILAYLPSLTGFNFGPEDIKERPELTYHRMIEAFNFAAAKETYLTDPLFSDKTDQVKGQRIIWNQTVLILYFQIYHNARCLVSFPSYFKTLSIGPTPGIEPATSRSVVKRSTDWANPAA